MERDFMGINGKDSGESKNEESNSRRQDSDYVGNSSVQWPFSKLSNMQNMVSYLPPHEERPKNAFDHLSSSGFQPVATEAQNHFNLNHEVASEFPMHPYQPQSLNTFGVSAHHTVPHPSVPAMNGPFFKVHGASSSSNLPMNTLKQQPFVGFAPNNANFAGSGVAAFAPRNVSKPASSQMTIFYGGTVNVFDDIPADKAHAIMLIASRASKGNAISTTSKQRSEVPAPSPIPKLASLNSLIPNQTLAQAQRQTTQIQIPSSVPYQTLAQTQRQTPTQNPSLIPYQTLSQTQREPQIQNPVHVLSPMPDASHVGAQLRSIASATDDPLGLKTVGLLPPSVASHAPSNVEPALAPERPTAVPQARKASLARFLEKRKQRVTGVVPYSCDKKSSETTVVTLESSTVLNNSSSADLSFSSNRDADLSLSSTREDSWCSVQLKNRNGSNEAPNTNLTM